MTTMDGILSDKQPFFTAEEKKLFCSKYRELLRNLYSFLQKEDVSNMKSLMAATATESTDCSEISIQR